MFSNTLSDYTFNQSGRLGAEPVDQSQQTLQKALGNAEVMIVIAR